MKVIQNGKVFDLDYDKYDSICDLPGITVENSLGGMESLSCWLRRDKMNGVFYRFTAKTTYVYNRRECQIEIYEQGFAAKIAEKYLTYDEYVKYFPDPEGAERAECREIGDLKEKVKSLENDKDFWYKQYNERDSKIKELEKKVEDLTAKLTEVQ